MADKPPTQLDSQPDDKEGAGNTEAAAEPSTPETVPHTEAGRRGKQSAPGLFTAPQDSSRNPVT